MRILRLPTVATVSLVLLVALAGPAVASGIDQYVAGTGTCEEAGTAEVVVGETYATWTDAVTCQLALSDKRVSGPAEGAMWSACFDHAASHCIVWGTMDLTGPEGTWAGSFRGVSDVADFDTSTVSGVLEGTGAYAGWTFLAQMRDDLVFGMVYEGPPPPVPVPESVAE